jgi:hypothetical protein
MVNIIKANRLSAAAAEDLDKYNYRIGNFLRAL